MSSLLLIFCPYSDAYPKWRATGVLSVLPDKTTKKAKV